MHMYYVNVLMHACRLSRPTPVSVFELQPDSNGNDVALHTFVERCESAHMSTWLAIVCSYKGVLMVRMNSGMMYREWETY